MAILPCASMVRRTGCGLPSLATAVVLGRLILSDCGASRGAVMMNTTSSTSITSTSGVTLISLIMSCPDELSKAMLVLYLEIVLGCQPQEVVRKIFQFCDTQAQAAQEKVVCQHGGAP